MFFGIAITSDSPSEEFCRQLKSLRSPATPNKIYFRSRNAKLPDDKVLLPGVIDSITNFVKHPELVAQRICRFADIVGRESVLASSDCGFGTFAGYGKMDPDISYKKLRAMVEGAEIASKRFWN